MKIRHRIVLGGLAVAALGTIVVLADGGRLPAFITNLYAFPYGDKVGHFCLMGGVAFCVNLALAGRKIHVRGLSLPLGSLLVAAGVALEEFSQNFFATRTPDLLDLTASLLGIWLLGGIALKLVALTRKKSFEE